MEGRLPVMALRLSGQLLLGVVKIYSRKTKYLLDECIRTKGDIVRINGKEEEEENALEKDKKTNKKTLALPLVTQSNEMNSKEGIMNEKENIEIQNIEMGRKEESNILSPQREIEVGRRTMSDILPPSDYQERQNLPLVPSLMMNNYEDGMEEYPEIGGGELIDDNMFDGDKIQLPTSPTNKLSIGMAALAVEELPMKEGIESRRPRTQNLGILSKKRIATLFDSQIEFSNDVFQSQIRQPKGVYLSPLAEKQVKGNEMILPLSMAFPPLKDEKSSPIGERSVLDKVMKNLFKLPEKRKEMMNSSLDENRNEKDISKQQLYKEESFDNRNWDHEINDEPIAFQSPQFPMAEVINDVNSDFAAIVPNDISNGNLFGDIYTSPRRRKFVNDEKFVDSDDPKVALDHLFKAEKSNAQSKRKTFSELSMGLNRRNAALMFYEILVLRSKGFVSVNQESSFGSIQVTRN